MKKILLLLVCFTIVLTGCVNTRFIVYNSNYIIFSDEFDYQVFEKFLTGRMSF